MPLRKPSDALAVRNPVILIYGDQDSGKTTIASSLKNPILFDFDKGIGRSEYSKDVFECDKDHIAAYLEFMDFVKSDDIKNYGYVVIDTAKALLDDYIGRYVGFADEKNLNPLTGGLNKSGYGDMGAIFGNNIMPLSDKCPILFMAHARTNQESLYREREPDITGGSSMLLLRRCDAIGYMTIEAGVRKLKFNKSDLYLSKGSFLGDFHVPAFDSEEFGSFLTDIINNVKYKLNKRYFYSIKVEYALGDTQESWLAACNKYKGEKNIAAMNAITEFLGYMGLAIKKDGSDKLVIEKI
jgi:hypothetical protein